MPEEITREQATDPRTGQLRAGFLRSQTGEFGRLETQPNVIGGAPSAVTSATPTLEARKQNIRQQEQDRLAAVRGQIGQRFEETLKSTRERGEAEQSGTRAQLGISRGLGFSSSRESFIKEQEKSNEKMLRSIERDRESALLSADTNSARISEDRIKTLSDQAFKLRVQAFNEGQAKLEESRQAEQSQRAERGLQLQEKSAERLEKAQEFTQGLQVLNAQLDLPIGETIELRDGTVITGLQEEDKITTQDLFATYSDELIGAGISPEGDLDEALSALQGVLQIKSENEAKGDLLKVQKLQSEINKNNAQAFKALNPTAAEKPATAIETLSAGFANRIEQSLNIMNSIESDVIPRLTGKTSIARSIPGRLKNSKVREQEQAERNFVNAVLRRESGAAIADSEFDSAAKQYFPQPGDDTATLANKKANRQQAFENIKLSAGNAFTPTSLLKDVKSGTVSLQDPKTGETREFTDLSEEDLKSAQEQGFKVIQ